MNIVPFERPAPPPEREAPPPPPLVNLPPLTTALLGLLLAAHLAATFLLDDAQRLWLFYSFGFVPGHYSADGGAPLWSLLAAPLAYMLLHGGWMHLAMNAAMLAAFGAGIERWIGPSRMAALFVLCGLCAALTQFLFDPFSMAPVVGASGAISGLFAAVMVMLRETTGLNAGGRGMWPFLALWIGITVATGLLGGPGGSAVAWQAHIGGFLSGFAVLALLRRWF